MPIVILLTVLANVLVFGAVSIIHNIAASRELKFKRLRFNWFRGVCYLIFAALGLLGTLQGVQQVVLGYGLEAWWLLGMCAPLGICMFTLLTLLVVQYVNDRRLIAEDNYIEAVVTNISWYGRRKHRTYVVYCECDGVEYTSRRLEHVDSRIEVGTIVRVHGYYMDNYLVELPQ